MGRLRLFFYFMMVGWIDVAHFLHRLKNIYVLSVLSFHCVFSRKRQKAAVRSVPGDWGRACVSIVPL